MWAVHCSLPDVKVPGSSLEPVIDVCALAGDDPMAPTECASAPVETITVDGEPPQFVRVDHDDEAYVATWSSTHQLEVGSLYRGFVRVGPTVLG